MPIGGAILLSAHKDYIRRASPLPLLSIGFLFRSMLHFCLFPAREYKNTRRTLSTFEKWTTHGGIACVYKAIFVYAAYSFAKVSERQLLVLLLSHLLCPPLEPSGAEGERHEEARNERREDYPEALHLGDDDHFIEDD